MKKVIGYRIIEPAPIAVRVWVSIALALLVLLLVVSSPTLAQDATDEPLVTNTPAVTEAAPPVEPVETPAPAPDAGFNLREFLIGALAGVATSLTAVFGIVGRIKNDKAALDAIEWLGKSIPVEALDKLNELGRTLRDAGEVLDRVTDGKANAPDPAAS